MTLVVLVSAGIGLGACGVVVSFRPRRPSLADVMRGLSTRGGTLGNEAAVDVRAWRMDRLLGERLAMRLRRRGYPGDRSRVLLAQSGSSMEELCSLVVLGGVAGFLLPPLCWIVLEAGGVRVAFAFPAWVGLLFGAGGCALPLASLRAAARRGRRAARRAVGAFLDLVVLGLAGGMGVESALLAAADVSDGVTSRRIASALVLARDSGDPPWRALADLGEELGIGELSELAAAVSLAGNEGARIRATLSAKAASIRRRELADIEAEANAVTERLFLPGIFLLIGFLVFIGYPAYVRIVSGL